MIKLASRSSWGITQALNILCRSSLVLQLEILKSWQRSLTIWCANNAGLRYVLRHSVSTPYAISKF